MDMPSNEEVLSQIKRESKLSLDYVQSKREQFRERLRLYNNQRKQRDKIGITTIYNTLNILLAIYYTNELSVSFSGRRIGAKAYAERWNRLADFDHDEMGLDIVNYQKEWDRLFFGVGIRSISSFDTVTKTPIARSLDPLSWLPDPKGSVGANSYRWHGFEVEINKSEMTEERGFIKSAVDKVRPRENQDSEHYQTKQARAEAQGLDLPSDNGQSEEENPVIPCYHWLTIIKGKKYLITVDQCLENVLRINHIKPVTAEEKKDESKVPFPLALSYYSPNRDDPFGTSVCDLTEDKQRAKSIMANLRISVEKARLYPMYMYNRHKILNRRDLDFGFNKFIGVNGAVDSTVVQPLQKDLGTQQGQIIAEQTLDREVQLSTGADETQAGIVARGDVSATEIQQTQANANLRFILHTRISSWGDRDFWRLWIREYRRNFGGEKIIRITTGFGDTFVRLMRKDFITEQDPDIKIVSKTEQRGIRERARVSFSAIVPLILQDPSKPAAAKKYAERHLLSLHDIPDEQINIMSPKSPDEMLAESENEFLSRNENTEVDIFNEDHLSHMLIHEAAEDSPAKFAHIEKHRQAYIISGQQAQILATLGSQHSQMSSLAAQSQAQIGAQNAQQGASNQSNDLQL